jgi:ArsR family transcriptional regulator
MASYDEAVVTTTTGRRKKEASGYQAACCVALEVHPLPIDVADELAVGFKALGDPHRVAIVHLLAAAREPVCVLDIEQHLPIGQSTVSYHLKALVEAGLLAREKRGRWMYYHLVPERLEYLAGVLEEQAKPQPEHAKPPT